MVVRLCAVVLFVAGLSSLRASEEPDVGALIRQLGSVKFADRETATKRLKELGDKAIPALEEAQASQNGETRRRAELLLHTVRQRHETERLLTGQKVRLQFENTPLLTALDRIGGETGLRFVLEGSREGFATRTVTLDTGTVSIFEALEQFCKKANLAERVSDAREVSYTNPYTLQINGRGDVQIASLSYFDPLAGAPARISLVDAKGQGMAPTFHTGAVRIRAIDSLLAGGKSSGPTVTLEVLADPKLPFRGVADVLIDRAIDEKGRTLSCDRDVAASTAIDNRRIPVRFEAEGRTTKLSELQGKITVLIQKTDQLIAVDGVRESSGKSFKGNGGEVLEVGEISSSDRYHTLQLRIRFSHASLPAQLAVVQLMRARRGFGSRTNADSITSNLLLFDAAGKAIPCTNSQTNLVPVTGGLVVECSMSYQAQPGQGSPTRLVYTGQRVVAVDVPFVLRNVPMQ